MEKRGYKIIIYVSVIAIFIGVVGLFISIRFDNKNAGIDSVVRSVKEGSSIVFSEIPVKDSENDLQVLRTFVPYGYSVESNVDWTLASYIYPAEISLCAYSKDKNRHLYFFSTKEYIEQLDENVDEVFGGEPLNDVNKKYMGAQDYLFEKVREMNADASNISIIKKETFTEEEISNMKKLVDSDARNLDILLSPDEENEDDEHGYVKIEETSVEPASIIFKFEDNGKEYKQQMSTILTSIIIIHRSESGKIHRERLWSAVAVYGYKSDASKFNENDEIYEMFIENTETDQSWLTALSRTRQDIFFDDKNNKIDIEIAKEMAPEIVKKAYFNEKNGFKSSHDLMKSMIDMWDFFNKDMQKYSYLEDDSLTIPKKYAEAYYSEPLHYIYMGTKHMELPDNWNEMKIIS